MTELEARANRDRFKELLVNIVKRERFNVSLAIFEEIATKFFKVLIRFYGCSVDQFMLTFKDIVGSLREGQAPQISQGEPGIKFSIKYDSSEKCLCILISTIRRKDNPLYDRFHIVGKTDHLDSEGSWVSTLYGLVFDRDLWIKSPDNVPSTVYVGGFRSLEDVLDFSWLIFDSKGRFIEIGVIDVRKRPWNRPFEFPGRYAIFLTY